MVRVRSMEVERRHLSDSDFDRLLRITDTSLHVLHLSPIDKICYPAFSLWQLTSAPALAY